MSYFRPVRRNFHFVPDLKRGDDGKSPITIYLQQQPIQPPAPTPRAGESCVNAERGGTSQNERQPSFHLSWSSSSHARCKCCCCLHRSLLFGGDKIAPADSCPLITSASARQRSVPVARNMQLAMTNTATSHFADATT